MALTTAQAAPADVFPRDAGHGVTIVCDDGTGLVAVSVHHPDLPFYLTDCCEASAKGGGNGVICRGCYEDVDTMLGGIPTLPAGYAA